jgi:hypothetical protein
MTTAFHPASRLLRTLACVGASWCGLAAAQGLDPAAELSPHYYFEAGGAPVARLTEPMPASQIEATGWAQNGTSAFGVALGASFSPTAPGAWRQTNSVGIGLRWRSTFDDRRRLDVATWRSLTDATETQPLTTRIEMQFSSPRSPFTELGAIGMQLSSDTRLTMKLRRGGPMVYYRSRF